MTDVSDRPTGPSRRTLVRAGAALGWTAPVLLTAVPAHAACVSPNAAPRLVATVNITRPNGASGATARNRTFNVSIENQGGVYTGAVAVRLTANEVVAGFDRYFETQVTGPGGAWTSNPATVDDSDPVTYTLNPVTLGCGATLPFVATMRINSLVLDNNVTFGVLVTAGTTTVYNGASVPATPV